ncbi:MAG: hypothetical protein E6I26_09105 [Chloroflexi bacterium]|nr:MAG: hypothetical protein E6I26_09105 [Chloroflexota bacterium]
MAGKKRASTRNRDRPRAEEFGQHGDVGVRIPWTSDDIPANQAVAGLPDQDQTLQTGPGTGGATEQSGRVPRHEGTHATNSAKG